MPRSTALWGHQMQLAGSWLAWEGQQLLCWALVVCTDGDSLLLELGARDTSRQRSRRCCCHVLLHTTADTPVAASVPVSQPAQRPSLLLDPLVPPYPRAFAFACHLCGHMSVNRQSWAGDYICYSNSTFYFFKTCLQFGSVPTPLSLPPLPLMPLPPNGSVTPISLWGGKRGKTDLD